MVYNHLISHFLFFVYTYYWHKFIYISSKKHHKTLGNSKNIRFILSAAELIFAKKIQKNLKKKKKIIDNIYINKDIYTYIPNPDPDIPIPIPRSRSIPGRCCCSLVDTGYKAGRKRTIVRIITGSTKKNLIFTW
jgi:hypothetical protein